MNHQDARRWACGGAFIYSGSGPRVETAADASRASGGDGVDWTYVQRPHDSERSCLNVTAGLRSGYRSMAAAVCGVRVVLVGWWVVVTCDVVVCGVGRVFIATQFSVSGA